MWEHSSPIEHRVGYVVIGLSPSGGQFVYDSLSLCHKRKRKRVLESGTVLESIDELFIQAIYTALWPA